MEQIRSDSVLGLVFSWPDRSMATLFDIHLLSILFWQPEILTGLPECSSPGASLLGLLLCLLLWSQMVSYQAATGSFLGTIPSASDHELLYSLQHLELFSTLLDAWTFLTWFHNMFVNTTCVKYYFFSSEKCSLGIVLKTVPYFPL